LISRWLGAMPIALAAVLAFACAQTAPSGDPKAAELQAAWAAADKTATLGPGDVALLDQATLKLPADYAFVPTAEGLRVMRALGNQPNPSTFAGLIVGVKQEDNWIIVLNFIKEGYIRDDDAKDWNADDLLTSLREGTDEANKQRTERGFPEIEIIGWVEKPAYDAQTHRLIWSMSTRTKGADPGEAAGVNYNTYALGRDGYFSLNLLTELSLIDAQKSIPRNLLANLAYNQGKRYEDFNSATDKVAEYGLAALIGVVAAKKLGFLALIGVFVAKFAKIIFIAVAGGGAVVARFFGWGKKRAAPPPDGAA